MTYFSLSEIPLESVPFLGLLACVLPTSTLVRGVPCPRFRLGLFIFHIISGLFKCKSDLSAPQIF